MHPLSTHMETIPDSAYMLVFDFISGDQLFLTTASYVNVATTSQSMLDKFREERQQLLHLILSVWEAEDQGAEAEACAK